MANSGSLTSGSSYGSLKMKFDWYIDSINESAGTSILHYNLYCTGDTVDYRIFGTDRNYCQLNGSDIFRISNIGSGAKSNPYKMYSNSSRHNLTPTYVQPPNYSFSGYIVRYGVLASGTRTLYYNDDGYTSFSVNGVFQWFYGAGNDKRVYISQTIYPDRINRYTKGQSSTNSGSGWSKNKFFYKTTDYGRTWTKCNAHKTTNGGSSWTRMI